MNASHPNEATQGRTEPEGAAGAQASTERLRSAAHERIDTVAEAVHPVVDRLTDAAHDTVERVSGAAAGAAERMNIKSEELRHMQGRLAEDCREYVRAHPLKALGYAAAAGFILTRLLRG
ncbi:MAG TPA: hypothetical protein PJ986_11245 [Gammaproteobacteria bacterium]|nr:hypothetical protein [Gammaproteobacteria bacterium]